MKATLEFTLPDDAEEYRLASGAGAMYAVLHAFAEYLRAQEKWVEPEYRDEIPIIRARFYDELEAHGVTLD